MSTIIKIPRDALKAVLLFAADRDIRYYLNAVLVEATGSATRIIATDGHMLGVHHSEQTNEVKEPTSLIVPRQAFAYLRPGKDAKTGRLLTAVQLEQDDRGWFVRDLVSGLRFGFDPIEAKYPDYIKVIPKTVSGVPAAFNPNYIGRLGNVAKAFKADAWRVSFTHNGDGAALVNISGTPGFVAVVMPMRGDGKAVAPEWAASSLLATTPKEEAVPA